MFKGSFKGPSHCTSTTTYYFMSTMGLFSCYPFLVKQADINNIFVTVGMVKDKLNLLSINTVLSCKMLGRDALVKQLG